MAAMGVRTVQDLIGQSDWLDKERAIAHWKAQGIDFTKLLYKPDMPDDVAVYHCEQQQHPIERVLDRKLIELAKPAIEQGKPVKLELNIRNSDRTTGAMLSGCIAKKYGHAGLPEDSLWITLRGSAGQSFGAWAVRGVTLDLIGEANDYVGKGLSGGRIIIRPAKESRIVPEQSIIIGNTVLYGAISGECYFRGVAGERFAVRNSGAIAVVEGTGDHGCEYMTGGVVVVIGQTGRNFAAGMSGGVAYVLDEAGDFEQRCNLAMVDLEPVSGEDEMLERLGHQKADMNGHGLVDVMHDMSRFDALRLKRLLQHHRRFTGSEKARIILEDFNAWLPKFVKVMPVEYRRALGDRTAAESEADSRLEIARLE
jgi:glutamate synthase (NADPH/NADH) large chain